MTNEEAIKELKYSYNENITDNEALEMAIKALEQEPCEDAISRQAVDEAIYDYSRSCDVNYAQIMEYIDKIPSVNPQPKTGHWIEYTRVLIPEPINKWEQAWYCSECGYGNQECENGSAWLEWKFCPDCGCRMVETRAEGEGAR